MYNTASIVGICVNIIIVVAYLIVRHRLPLKQQEINQDKKQFLEQLFTTQQDNTININTANHYPTPRMDYISSQPHFIRKFFIQFYLLNYCHTSYMAQYFIKEFKCFGCRNQSLFWLSLVVPLIFYQLVAQLNIFYSLPLMLIISLLNIFQSHYHQNKLLNIEDSFAYIIKKQTILKEIFPQTYAAQNQLDRYLYALQQYSQPNWLFCLLLCSFLISLTFNYLEWYMVFGFLYGSVLEQISRYSFCILYGQRKAKQWILNGPDCVYEEMNQLAQFYKITINHPERSNSPQKYIMNDTHNVSDLSKDQSQNILIHQSTNDLLKQRPKALRVTSANLGTIEDTKLDIADLQGPQQDFEKPLESDKPPLDSEINLNKQIIQTEQTETQAEEAIFKKKRAQHRIKLEALYHSKNTQRTPMPPPQFYSNQKSQRQNENENQENENENKREKQNRSPFNIRSPLRNISPLQNRSPMQDINPIKILQHLSPIMNDSAQREQFPHTFEDHLSNIKVNSPRDEDNNDTISIQQKKDSQIYIDPIEPLKILSQFHQNRSSHNGSFGSGKGRRNKSQKTSKEEEEQSYIERRALKVSTTSKQRRSPEQKRRKSTNTKTRGDSMKVRKREDIPVLNFNSDRFKSPYLEFLPHIVEQQRTQRKQNQSENKKKLNQMIQVYENNQTSNENREIDD